MRFHRLRSVPRSFSASVMGALARALLLVVLCLALTACFGSSRGEAAPTNTPEPAPTAAPTDTPVEVPATPESNATPASGSANEASSGETTAEEVSAEVTPTEAAESGDAEVAEAASEPLIFQIDPEQSEARFIVDEVLFGNPNTVTGRTNEVSGTIEIDLNNPPQTTVSVIQVNARSLATDNRFRNRSVNRLILQSNRDEYQYITFTPAEIDGLPDEVSVGDTFSFQITGDLKIREIIQPVIFDVTVTADSESQISGLAQTVVQRADFELTIPNVEGVADVSEDVRLELEFVATASD